MGGDHAEYSSLNQLAQYRLGYRTADHRLRTRSHLVDKDQRPLICLTKECPHVAQVGRIGR